MVMTKVFIHSEDVYCYHIFFLVHHLFCGLFFVFLLKYSCLYFPSTTFSHPTHTHSHSQSQPPLSMGLKNSFSLLLLCFCATFLKFPLSKYLLWRALQDPLVLIVTSTTSPSSRLSLILFEHYKFSSFQIVQYGRYYLH